MPRKETRIDLHLHSTVSDGSNTPEELLGGKRRCLFGCDSDADTGSLPTTAGFTLPDGSKTAAPAPFSYALVRGGDVLALGSDGTWEAL